MDETTCAGSGQPTAARAVCPRSIGACPSCTAIVPLDDPGGIVTAHAPQTEPLAYVERARRG